MDKKIRFRGLERRDRMALEAFLKGLNDDVFANWNRFGFSLRDCNARRVASEQCLLPVSREKGFIAVDKGESIAAYGYLRFFPENIMKRYNATLGIVVAPSYQGRGIGLGLMRCMHSWAKRSGIKKIWLGTYYRNKASLHLYRRLGYQVEGVFMFNEVGIYGWEHVVSMAVLLDKKFRNAGRERARIIKEIESGRFR